MSGGLDTRPSATMFDIERLVNMAWSGHIRVPHFQRDFRWQRKDVIRLFDSIVRGYPVGSLLLWQRPARAQTVQLGALSIDALSTDQALWVVDGQQRITSLANALNADGAHDPRFSLAYNLVGQQFVPRPAVEDPLVIPLPILFDLRATLRWFAANPDVTDYVDRANEITRTLRQFQVPAYQVVEGDAKVLQDIFDRMNNYGKRLSRAEIFSALFAGAEEAKDETLTFDRIAQGLDEDLGFGVIDNDTVLKAVLARRSPDVMREIRNEFSDQNQPGGRSIVNFPDEDRDTAYQRGGEALRRAVSFLQDHAGVPHFSMLAYRHLLVVLTRFFAHHPEPDERSQVLLRRWFWRAAVSGPENFKGSTTGAVRALSFAINTNNMSKSISDLLSLVDRPDSHLPDLRRFRSNEAATKITLCAWWAHNPRSLNDGEIFEREDLSASLIERATAFNAVRYIIPRVTVPEQYRLWAANRVIHPILDVEVGAIEDLVISRTEGIADDAWDLSLRSHMITPEMVQLLSDGMISDFLNARQDLLQEQLTSFLQRECEWGFEDTPPLADLLIEDLEEVDE